MLRALEFSVLGNYFASREVSSGQFAGKFLIFQVLGGVLELNASEEIWAARPALGSLCRVFGDVSQDFTGRPIVNARRFECESDKDFKAGSMGEYMRGCICSGVVLVEKRLTSYQGLYTRHLDIKGPGFVLDYKAEEDFYNDSASGLCKLFAKLEGGYKWNEAKGSKRYEFQLIPISIKEIKEKG